MSDDPTPLSLPSHLPYPIVITRLFPSSSNDALIRGSKILEYSFTSDTSRRALAKLARDKSGNVEGIRKRGEGEEEGVGENDMIGSWECPVEGEFVKWGVGVKVGMIIERKHAARPVIYVQQPCTHPVQLHGLCGICGKELNENDYITPQSASSNAAGPSNYPGAYEMGHDGLGVTVSNREAKRLDTQARDDLLTSRRLALIVDLDQTIIHTTVDPTVGEWLDEIKRNSQASDSASPTKTSSRIKENANTVALGDVACFQLPDEDDPGPGRRMVRPAERWYYTKPRPGLPEFLEKMSEMYEMHVYTMGTRSYADAICRAVDPDGKIFGGRILSRDESGSVKSKDLKRLFPTDQSMVVVIDDRMDVWGDIPNLVKVIPYDFFVGIGDINSNPAKPGIDPTKKIGGARPAKTSSRRTTSSIPDKSPSQSPAPTSIGTPESGSTIPDSHSPEIVLAEEIEEAERKEERLHQLEEERPLKKLAEKLEREQSTEKDELNGDADTGLSNGNGKLDSEESTTTVRSTTPEGSPPPTQPILRVDDRELDRLTRILTQIHDSFYSAYDSRSNQAGDDDGLPMDCDVELIIPDMKSRVLEGCRLVFSGLIAKGVKVEQSELGLLSFTYGARPLAEISPDMTHCVCLQKGTEKTYRSNELRKWVVKLEWLLECVAQWRKVDERPYDCHPETTKKKIINTGDGISSIDGEVHGIPSDLAEMHDPGFEQGGWDAEAEREMQEFLDGSEDGLSDMGSVPSPPTSVPGTPRKRVRYADEEDLPLSSFRDPPIKRASFDEHAENGGESPERKRKVPIRLPPPPNRSDENEAVEKLELSEKQRERIRQHVEENQDRGDDDASEADTEEVDEFAQMLMDSLGE